MTASLTGGRQQGRGLWRAPLLLFSVTLVVRLAALLLLGSAQVSGDTSAWAFGHEVACLAQSLLSGGPYGDPWGQGTGASAWLTPLYPAWVAACFWLGGGITSKAAWLLLSSHAIVSAATACLVRSIGQRCAGRQAGAWAGWIFAFHPLATWFAAETIWDTTFVAAAISLLCWLALRTKRPVQLRASVGMGVACGAALMLNAAVMSFLPALLWYTLGGLRWRQLMLRLAAFAVAALLCCAPWLLRNHIVLGSAALRTNFGVELRVGNLGDSAGRHATHLHPSHAPAELARYRELGEVAYAQWAKKESLRWIQARPLDFALLCGRRFLQFWLGELPWLDQRQEAGRDAASDPKAWLKWGVSLASGLAAVCVLWRFSRGSREFQFLAMGLLLFPAPYILTHVSERYRFPMEPLIVVCLGAGISHWSCAKARSGENQPDVHRADSKGPA